MRPRQTPRQIESLESRHMLTAFSASLLSDITPGSGSTEFGSFQPVGEFLYFTADGNPWRTDGTSVGTVPVAEIPDLPPDENAPEPLTPAQEQLLADAQVLADDMALGPFYDLQVFGDRVFMLERFDADGYGASRGWVSDGNSNGTFALQSEYVSPSFPWIFPVSMSTQATINGFVFFGHGDAMFRTDGTAAGTVAAEVGIYVGKLNDVHYFETPGGTSVLGTRDGLEFFSTLQIYEQQQPGLPAPPSGIDYSIQDDTLVRFQYDGRDWNSRSVLIDGGFVSVAQGVPGSTAVYPVFDTWYGTGQDRQFQESLWEAGLSTIYSECALQCGFNLLDIGVLSNTNKPADTPLVWSLGNDIDQQDVFAQNRSLVPELLFNDEAVLLHQVEGGSFFWSNGQLVVTDGNSETITPLTFVGDLHTDIEFITWDKKAIVVAQTPTHGQELWVVDGPTAASPYSGLLAELPLYRISHGQPLALEVTTNLPASNYGFAWDLNDDGDYTDAFGPSPTLSAQQIDALGVPLNQSADEAFHPISVRITNTQSSEIHVEKSLLRIVDQRPVIDDIRTGEVSVVGQPMAIEVFATDGGPLHYSFDLGDGNVVEQSSNTLLHAYQNAGVYTVQVTVVDTLGQITSATTTVSVLPVQPEDAWIFQPSVVFGGNDLTVDVDLLDTNGNGLTDRLFTTVASDWNETWSIFLDQDSVRVVTNAQYGNPEIVGGGSVYGAVGDVNNDGQLQTIVVSFDGIEGWSNLPESNVKSYDVALGDLDGDGDSDVFVANFQTTDGSPAADWIFFNNGDGSLSTGTNFTASTQRLGSYRSRSVELGDLDGDGDLDAVTAGLAGSHIWFNDGTGQFSEAQQQITPGGEHVALSDLDGDGDLDLFAVGSGGNHVWFNSNGFFSDSGQSLGSSSSSHVQLGDFDLDGDPDAFVANWEGDANTVWINSGAGFFIDSGARLAASKSTEHVALGDIDGDGDLDVVTAGYGSPNHVYLNKINDAYDDLIVTDTIGAYVAEFGPQATQLSRVSDWMPTINFGSGDLDGDGLEDIVGHATDGKVWVHLDGAAPQLFGKLSPEITWTDFTVADFDGDGMDDVMVRADSNGSWWVLKSTGSQFTYHQVAKFDPIYDWTFLTGDFNRDGKTDIAGRAGSNGDWWVGLSDGIAAPTSKWGSWPTSSTWTDLVVGDFNGDRRADIAGRADNSTWWVSESSGYSFSVSPWAGWNGTAWEHFTVGDFNHDGLDDIVGRAQTTGDWWMAESEGNSLSHAHWGNWPTYTNWHDVQEGDFNADGRSDLIGRADNGEWWILESKGSRFTGRFGANFGPFVEDATTGNHGEPTDIGLNDNRDSLGAVEFPFPEDTLFADFDGNSVVDFVDFLVLSTNYGAESVSRDQGDANGDGAVNFEDFLLLSTTFGLIAT